MTNRFAMVTRCDENAKDLADVTHEILKDYAGQWGCDFIVLSERELWMTDYELAHYRILKVRELLEKYERIVVIDSDIIIMPGTPNPFCVVPEEMIGSIYEDKGSREAMRQGVIIKIQERFGDVGWEEGYINTGFFIVSRQHANIFERIPNDREQVRNGKYDPLTGLWDGFGYDDALLGYNIHRHGHKVYELPFHWNHMAMFSESWNNCASRFMSYIIHYAGRACFPDDLSGRGIIGDNSISKRLMLIKNDIDRIVEGLMNFKDAKPCEIQGLGSQTLDVKVGVQELPMVLKIPNTPQCLARELEVLKLRIPNTVTFLGMGEDDAMGKFIMLEKLHPLPDEMTNQTMIKVATSVMIASRQLWKMGIPWICKEEHIMMDEAGNVKLIDFGDDPYMPIPFYAKDHETEAIIMPGECCQDGKYQMRYKYPLSGYVAVIRHLCDKSGLSYEALYEAETNMVTYEYQQLKDVHQPIHQEEWSHIMRTESEPDDPDYGKLVDANRECEDRSIMIFEHIEPWMTNDTTWLDVGCNVGWFCFEFSPHFKMTGLDKDFFKIQFAKMMESGDENYNINFIDAEMTVGHANTMPYYDVISVMSMMHLKLNQDKDPIAFWDLFKAITAKAEKMFLFEFPKYAVPWLNIMSYESFLDTVKDLGNFDSVEEIGITDNGRPMLKCLK